MTGPDDDNDELAEALRQSRERFIASFPTRCIELQLGFATLPGGGSAPEALQHIAHKIAGVAGIVGFPSVSRIASDMETLLTSKSATKSALLENLAALREAYAHDAVEPVERVEVVTARVAPGHRILVVDDDPEQREITTRTLERGGYDVVALPAADTVLETAERVKPSAILLDVMMPGINGHLACRLLKGEPTLAEVPVMFVSSNAALDERMAGLALGAVDYVAKPYDVNELLFRVKRVIENRAVPSLPAVQIDDVLEYTEFAKRAVPLLAEPCTLVLMKVDPSGRDQLARMLVAESRRRDLVAQFDRLHLVMLLPGLGKAAVITQLAPVLERVAQSGVNARAGLAESPGEHMTLDALVQDADEALSAARFHGLLVGHKGAQPPTAVPAAASQMILLADDDPEVSRIVDAQMRSLRFATTLAFDGQAALALLSANPVNLLILDLMLPKVTGFEILHHLQQTPEPRPRLIVLSAKGREEDITRAFELGADDYITKPFRPQELASRVVRLLR